MGLSGDGTGDATGDEGARSGEGGREKAAVVSKSVGQSSVVGRESGRWVTLFGFGAWNLTQRGKESQRRREI